MAEAQEQAPPEQRSNSQRTNQGYLRAVPLANGMLIATSLYAFAWCLFSILHHKPQLYLKLGPAAVSLASILALRLRPRIRIMTMSLAIGAGVGLYAAEAVALALIDPDRSFREAVRDTAGRSGLPYDGRDKIDVIVELRRRGIQAYPPFYPYLTLGSLLKVDGVPTIPLGSAARAMTVCCNEGGQYLIYPTDEYGFANPPGLWRQTPVDVALVGASVATGECVPSVDSIASQLRKRYPKTISLGAGGNGPLLELASIREYLPALKPVRILWIFSESHTAEYLEKESNVPLLRYLDDSFQQGLFERQDAIDRTVRSYLEDATQAELDSKGPSLPTAALELVTLKRVREMVSGLEPRSAVGLNAGLYERVLRRGRQIAGAWGGRIAIVYVPDSARYPGAFGYSPERRREYDRTRASVLDAARKVGIPVIDISQRFPDLPPSQWAQYERYFYPYFAHFTPEGYRIMDRAILEELP
jgi:hypothetical protein